MKYHYRVETCGLGKTVFPVEAEWEPVGVYSFGTMKFFILFRKVAEE